MADYPNQYALFLVNSCSKLMAERRVWQIKWWWINKNHCIIIKFTFILQTITIIIFKSTSIISYTLQPSSFIVDS